LTPRVIIRLGQVTIEAPLEPEALRALIEVFQVLGVEVRGTSNAIVIRRASTGGDMGERLHCEPRLEGVCTSEAINTEDIPV